jgi:hypothetical protein
MTSPVGYSDVSAGKFGSCTQTQRKISSCVENKKIKVTEREEGNMKSGSEYGTRNSGSGLFKNTGI